MLKTKPNKTRDLYNRLAEVELKRGDTEVRMFLMAHLSLEEKGVSKVITSSSKKTV